MRLGLAPCASTGLIGAAPISRTLAKLIVGPNAVARAMCEFVLLTLARNRGQQAAVAINAALGAATIVAALSKNVRHLELNPDEPPTDDLDSVTVLGIGGIARHVPN